MAHVLVLGHVHASGLDRLRAAGHALEILAETDAAGIQAAMPRADAILVRTAPVRAVAIDAAPNLRVVSKHGVGVDNIDVAALTARRIPCAVAATANRVAVAEHALFLMLELAKAGRRHDREVRAGNWLVRNEVRAFELYGKRLLLVGFGRIGLEVARRAQAFGMEVVAFDPLQPDERLAAAGVARAADLRTALAEADVVSLHLPYSPAVRNLIDAAALAAMKPTAILINTARGGLVDETALADALRAGRLRGAGIDVLEAEPPPAGHPLFAVPDVLLSPHSAAVTAEAMLRMAVESADNVVAALAGTLDPGVVINPEVLS